MASDAPTLPISEISSYHSRWMIKARVTGKSPLRQFNSRGGAGKVFSVELLDKFGGEIRASVFNQGADKYFDLLVVGKVYVFSRGSVKIANRQFNPTNHRYELTFDKEAVIAPSSDDAEIKTVQFNFIDLRAVQAKTLPATVDICGVVASYKPVLSFTSSAGKALVKRELTIVDDTATSIEIVLWGERAETPDSKFDSKPLMAFKGVLVKEWNGGRAGSLIQNGVIEFDPTGPEAERVKQWWTNGGSSANISALSASGPGGGAGRNSKHVSSLSDIRDISESLPENTEFYSVAARLAIVQTQKQGQKQPLSYMACTAPREGTSLLCNKRVSEDGTCPVCGSVGKATARLNIRCKFVDFSDSVWMGTFHEGATSILGMTAEEVNALEKNSSEENSALEEKLKLRYYMGTPFQVTVRAKTETYQGEARTAINCIDARPVSRAEQGRRMLAEIHQMVGAPAA